MIMSLSPTGRGVLRSHHFTDEETDTNKTWPWSYSQQGEKGPEPRRVGPRSADPPFCVEGPPLAFQPGVRMLSPAGRAHALPQLRAPPQPTHLRPELRGQLVRALQLLLHLLQHLPLHGHLLLQVLVPGLGLAEGLLGFGRLHFHGLDDIL